MDSLSDELLCSILAHLDPWTLSRSVQYVSKRLRRLALENRLWYTFTRPDPSYILASKPLYTHWMDIDWHNEWKWQEPALGCFANDARRNAPLRTTFIDDSVTVLTFGLHRSDIVALTDDGSLRRWRKSDSQWQEISHTKSLAGRESFRIRRTAGCGNRVSSTTQLGYNDAIAMGDESIFFGVGQSLQKLDVESGKILRLYDFDSESDGRSLITTIWQLSPTTIVFGSYPGGIHVLDVRQPSKTLQQGVVSRPPSADQATPLSIRTRGYNGDSILVCGRFPSVLSYDLRVGLSACRSVYSGAESLSSMALIGRDRVIVGGSYRGRGTLESINTRNLTFEAKNRWTASNATILAVAPRNGGVFAAGGSGSLRLLSGIHTGMRDVDINRMITKIQLERSAQEGYYDAIDRVYLGCGTDGVACVEFGHPPDDGERHTQHASSLLAGQFSDLHFFGRRVGLSL